MHSTGLNTAIRLRVLEQSRRANVGHIGSALSIADIVAVLFDGVMRVDGDDRDRFILSKGHAALALYAALHETGVIDGPTLDTFCGEGSALGAHPEHTVPGIDFSSGSLGQGLSVAAGAALAARIQGSSRRSYALLSDAETNEGSVWEAVMFAGHHRLGALTAIVDVNRQQALGFTRDVIDLEPLQEKFASFGWAPHVIDGHDLGALRAGLNDAGRDGDAPHVILAQTTFGSGVSFMEGEISWHYWPLSDAQFDAAVGEVQAAAAEALAQSR